MTSIKNLISAEEKMSKLLAVVDEQGRTHYKFCLRCGRELKREKYELIGYGPICLRKITQSSPIPSLFDLFAN